MKSKSITSFLSGLCLLLATISIAGAGELPPPGSKPLSAILKSVEGLELGVITRSEFDDGWWEVKVCKGPACHKLYIDPRSGEEKRRREAHSDNELPPANGKPLLAIVQSIEDSKAGVITEVKFDDGFWKSTFAKTAKRSSWISIPGLEGQDVKRRIDLSSARNRKSDGCEQSLPSFR